MKSRLSSAEKMRVAYLFQAPGLRFSDPQAMQLHIYHTLRGLQEAGHDSALLALYGRQVLFTRDLRVFHDHGQLDEHFGKLGVSNHRHLKLLESGVRRGQRLMGLPYMAMFDSFRMRDAVLQNLRNYDVLHERFNLLAIGGALASRKLGIPYVLEVNADLLAQRRLKGKAESGIRRLWAEWTTKFAFNAADRVICVSESLSEHLRNKWQVSGEQLTTLPCAADISMFDPKESGQPIREKLGIDDEPLVMWVGGFYPWHDLGLMLESFSRVHETNPTARLVLIGDGEMRDQIKRQVTHRRLNGSVLLTGSVPHTAVPEFLAAADVVLAPAPVVPAAAGGTGTPLKLFEYMAAGKAIVATEVEQTNGILQHEQTAILVPPGDSGALAAAITSLLQNRRLRQQLGQNARRQAVKRHSWARYTTGLQEIYAQIIHNAVEGP